MWVYIYVDIKFILNKYQSKAVESSRLTQCPNEETNIFLHNMSNKLFANSSRLAVKIDIFDRL